MNRKHQYPTTAQAVQYDLDADGSLLTADGWPTDVLTTADTSIWY